jgi:tRNA-specific 2-thiouridylase
MSIAILLSGGVDSSVALKLLQEEGRSEITAFYLKIWLEDDAAFLGDCPWEDDLGYVRSVCDQAGVPLEIISLQSEYRERIVDFAVQELKAGRTPSPDIQCNERIKFGVFYDRIDSSYEIVATGHYAQIGTDGSTDKLHLLRAPDPVKDQTYFLSRLSQGQLQRICFPIGHLQKSEVRQHAEQFDLPNKTRKDSQGICFLGKVRFSEFVNYHLGEKPGKVIDKDSDRVLGPHKGYWYFTIGQRQGLGFHGGPWYVTGKDIDSNIVYVSHADRYRERARNRFKVHDLHWIAEPPDKRELQVRVRHGPTLTDCILEMDENAGNVTMQHDDPGIAPGQSAVFYDGEECLGSGVIAE